ncbi:MAG: DUF6179 domain-containing protein [Oscillospiraceae bacterium]|nr:DUF6179 domain-containing protein [Oscillospiraceae bacterium]
MNEQKKIQKQESPFSQDDLLDLQLRLCQLAAKRTSFYTTGDSSSVPKETAQELLASILYTLQLSPNSSPADLARFRGIDLEKAFEAGIKTIEHKIARAKRLWQTMCCRQVKIENQSLSDTLKSIGKGFGQYDYRFFAHRFPCSIDYQLCHPVAESCLGIDYILSYLRRLLTENDLLRRFDTTRCICLLRSASPDYRGLLVNLYEPVATNALGLALLGKDISVLNCPAEAETQIRALLAGRSKHERFFALQGAADEVCAQLGIQSKTSAAYLKALAQSLCPRINALLKAGSLSGVFLSFSIQ